MTTEILTAGLSKLDLRALREADRVSFHQYQGDGTGRIVCTKRVKDAGPWEERERDYNITCESIVGYSLNGDSSCPSRDALRLAKCFAMYHGAQFHEEWQTIVACLKTGDVLILQWQGNGGNGYVRRATVTETDDSCANAGLGMRLYHDSLTLRVKREGKRDLVFHLYDSVCPDNTARMIKV